MQAVFTRIRFRILGIVLMAVIPAIGLIFYSAAARKGQIIGEIEGNAGRLSRFLASNLERDIAEVEVFLKAASALLEAEGVSDSARARILSSLAGDSASPFANLGLASAEGRVLLSTRPMPENADLNKLDWFDAMKSAPGYTVGFDLGGVVGKEASLNLAYPVVGGKVGVHGILFAVIDMDWLNELSHKAQLPEGSAVSVTNRSGELVARYPDPDKWIGKPYPRVHILGDDKRPEGIKVAEGIDGVKRLYAYAAVKAKGGLVVYVGMRREAALAPANRVLWNHLSALGAVSLLALLAAWFGSDVFLLKQVRALIAATRKLAAGNLATRSSLPYDRGELGELARAFDEMAETLEWRDAQLRESENERANPTGHIFEMVESAPEPMILLDESLAILAANRLIRELFGFESGDMIGLSFRELCPDIVALDGDLGQAWHMQTRGKRKNGDSIALQIAFTRSSHRQKPMFIGIIRPAAKGDA